MSFFPPDYKPAAGANTKTEEKATPNANYIDQSKIADGEKAVMIICGQYPDHVISGKSYWTQGKDGERACQRKFPFHKGVPSNYKDEIQLSFDANKRNVVYGQHNEKDLAYPRSFVTFFAYFNKANAKNGLNVLAKFPDLQEQGSFKIVTFDRNDLRESLEDTLSMDSYFAHQNGIHNFKVTLKRKGTGTDTSYGRRRKIQYGCLLYTSKAILLKVSQQKRKSLLAVYHQLNGMITGQTLISRVLHLTKMRSAMTGAD